jgi:hypothetical protein
MSARSANSDFCWNYLTRMQFFNYLLGLSKSAYNYFYSPERTQLHRVLLAAAAMATCPGQATAMAQWCYCDKRASVHSCPLVPRGGPLAGATQALPLTCEQDLQATRRRARRTRRGKCRRSWRRRNARLRRPRRRQRHGSPRLTRNPRRKRQWRLRRRWWPSSAARGRARRRVSAAQPWCPQRRGHAGAQR